MTFPDFGNMQDNEIALQLALEEIEKGSVAWGCEVLLKLREHIYMTQETKSVQWILPQVEDALQRFCETAMLLEQHNTVTPDTSAQPLA